MSAKDSTPGFARKREMLASDQPSPQSLSDQGRELVALDLLDDALNFFLKAEDREGMEEVLARSRSQGDTFTFEAASRALGISPSREEWEELGEKALAAGKLWFAYRAFEKGESQKGLEKTRRLMAEQGIPPD